MEVVDRLGIKTKTALIELDVGQKADNLIVIARNPWNRSGVLLRAKERYLLEVRDVQCWRDAGIKSEPQAGHIKRRWWLEIPPLKWLRRYKNEGWYTLVGSVGKDRRTFFLIGTGLTYSPDTSGELFSFANDARWFYWNNQGKLRLFITRLT